MMCYYFPIHFPIILITLIIFLASDISLDVCGRSFAFLFCFVLSQFFFISKFNTYLANSFFVSFRAIPRGATC